MRTSSLPHESAGSTRYKIERSLGTGGMARLYVARQQGVGGFERQVVLKTLLHDDSDEAEVAMLLEEARLSAYVSHPNVIRVLDIVQVDGRWHVAMEFLSGHNLSQVMVRAHHNGLKLGMAMSASMMLELLDALEAVHQARDASEQPLGLIHRDVSPQNLVITNDGVCKLVDFGIAKQTHNGTPRTHAGTIKGKIPYMSPEQVRSGDLDQRSDLFSAGVMFWEMLTWRRLFHRPTMLETMKAVVEGPIPPPSQLAADVPPELDALVLGLLQRDVERRPESAALVQEELARIIDRHQLRRTRRDRSQLLATLFGDDATGQTTIEEATRVNTPTSEVADGPLGITGDDELFEEALVIEITPESPDDTDASIVTPPLRLHGPPATNEPAAADASSAEEATVVRMSRLRTRTPSGSWPSSRFGGVRRRSWQRPIVIAVTTSLALLVLLLFLTR